MKIFRFGGAFVFLIHFQFVDMTTCPDDSLTAYMQGNSYSTYPLGHNVNNRFENQQSPASPKPTDLATDGLVYSSDSSMLNNANFISSELPVLKNQQVTQTAVTSVSSQHLGSPIGLASQWVDVPLSLMPCPQSLKNLPISFVFPIQKIVA